MLIFKLNKYIFIYVSIFIEKEGVFFFIVLENIFGLLERVL